MHQGSHPEVKPRVLQAPCLERKSRGKEQHKGKMG